MKRHIITCIIAMMFVQNILAQEYLSVNGKFIPVSRIKSIKTSVSEHSKRLSAAIERNQAISIYAQALVATGIMDSLKCYKDETYGFVSEQAKKDSCTWTNDDLCIFTGAEYDNVAYPTERLFQHTVFAVTDKVLQSKYGIRDLNGLRAKAKQIYDEVYPEDAGISNEKDRRNSLNRFISYHVLNIYGTYYNLTANDGYKLQYNFNREKYDIHDWYETLMPYSTMKLSFPSGSQSGLYINRRGVQDRPDMRGVFVRGAKVYEDNLGPEDALCVNGTYHCIDDIISYNKETQEVVFDDRIRIDCTTLSPDFMTFGEDGQMPRGHHCDNPDEMNFYGYGGQDAEAATNRNHCLGFKSGYVRNFQFDNNTHIHVRNRVLGFWSYEGDEVTIKGKYDVKIKLPPVPAGTYEVRLMTCTGFTSRGIVAAYIDGVPQIMPVDMRPNGTDLFGHKTDNELNNDEEAIAAYDRSIHNKGWMRGPGCYKLGDRSSYDNDTGTSMRDLFNTVRCVLGHFKTDGKSDHYLRLLQLKDAGGEIDFDFIELVPSTVYDNEYYLEDIY